MDQQKKIQTIINRFLSKMAEIKSKKNKIISTETQEKDTEALSQVQKKIKNL